MNRIPVVLTAALALALASVAQAQTLRPNESASLRITQRALVAVCVNDTPVPPSTRRWTVGAQDVRLTVTMRNDPRFPADGDGPAGTAVVSFRAEAGHRYEVEVRADGESFSRRVWTAGNWTPVVRDRTTDEIVSTAPDWATADCRVP